MMDREDQFGAAEDIVKRQLHGSAVEEGVSAQYSEQDLRDINSMRQAMRSQNKRILTLASEVKSIGEKNNESVVMANAAALTLRDAAEMLAEATNRPLAEISRQLNELRSIRYDHVLQEAMGRGAVKEDPRKGDLMQKRLWYVPEAQRTNGG